MTARLTDLRLQVAPWEVRGPYALLYDRRAELPLALASAPPEAVLAAVLGCATEVASVLLARMVDAGLVTPALCLLVGRGVARPVTERVTVTAPVTDDLAARVRASGRTAVELARAAGIDRSSLAYFLAGKKGLGTEKRAAIEAALVAGVTVTGHTLGHSDGHSHNLGHTPAAPSPVPPSLPSPPAPPSDSPSLPTLSPTTPSETAPAREAGAKGEGETPGPGAPTPKSFALEPQRQPKTKRQPKPEIVDPVPEIGTTARAIYDAILGDARLGPITEGPGRFALHAANPAAYPGVTVLAEVLAAGEWLSRQREGSHTKGRAFLVNWLRRAARELASMPRPVAAAAASPAAARPPIRGRAPLGTREEFARDAAQPIDASFYEETRT